MGWQVAQVDTDRGVPESRAGGWFFSSTYV